jgi:hypothetical protein
MSYQSRGGDGLADDERGPRANSHEVARNSSGDAGRLALPLPEAHPPVCRPSRMCVNDARTAHAATFSFVIRS